MPDSFSKFTEGARLVLDYAEEEAHRLNHNYVGTEHLLLGLIRNEQGHSGRVLAGMGLTLDQFRVTVENMIGKGTRPPAGNTGLTARVKRVIELAVEEARNSNTMFIGSEHLLLGLIREDEGIAIGMLRNLKIDPQDIRKRVSQMLNQSSNQRKETENARNEKLFSDGAKKIDKSTRFEVFNDGARAVLTQAQEEAQRHNHNFIGTEHFLLGLIRDEKSIASSVLMDMGVQVSKIRSSVEFIIGRGDRAVMGEIGLTPRAKKVIDLTIEEARLLKHGYIGPEHLLLGMIKEGEGIAAGVLASLNVELDETRQRVKQAVDRKGDTSE